MHFRLIQARTVAEHRRVFAEALAVVRDDDHPGPSRTPRRRARRSAGRPARRDRRRIRRRRRRAKATSRARACVLAAFSPVLDQARSRLLVRGEPRIGGSVARELIGVVGVVVIQEGEERPLAAAGALRQPVEELAIDLTAASLRSVSSHRESSFDVRPQQRSPAVLQEIPGRFDPAQERLTRTADLERR